MVEGMVNNYRENKFYHHQSNPMDMSRTEMNPIKSKRLISKTKNDVFLNFTLVLIQVTYGLTLQPPLSVSHSLISLQ